MLTYIFDTNSKLPLYQQLYFFIRNDIESGVISRGEKLPSKRKLAVNLEISVITVEGAYHQLLAEGYIVSIEKRGVLC